MVTIKKQQFLLQLTEHWFDYQFKWTDLFLPVCYRGLREKQAQRFYFGTKKYTKTIILPLEESLDVIKSRFSTTLKYDIKKAEAEGIVCCFNHDIKDFIQFYNDFAKVKKLIPLDINRIKEWRIKEWKCTYAKLEGNILVAHSYLEDKQTGIVRLMQSGSLRFDGGYSATQIGYANKLLHFHDIQYFKENGLKVYDFGGWDDLPGLQKFKQSFGAYPIKIFNYFTYTYTLKESIQKLAGLIKRK